MTTERRRSIRRSLHGGRPIGRTREGGHMPRFAALSTPAGSTVAFLLTGAAAHAQGHGSREWKGPKEKKEKTEKEPKASKLLVLDEQGSFYVGGAIQFRG